MSNLIGKTFLNQFRVDAFIASGGMGAVYRVWDSKRNVPLAMKTLHSDLADDPTILKRFKREANALRKLTHPNIVQFYGLFQTDDISFLLEQFIDGPTLAKIIKARKGKPFPIEEALIYLKAMCAALGYAHANGVVHCDVKPGNIMVDPGGNIYLTDFGIARHADSTTTTLAGIGTAAYMAPEQIRSEPVAPATDIYALGLILFEMLTGQRPFRGTATTGTPQSGATAHERVRLAQLTQMPPNPRSLNPQLSESVCQVILQSLSKDPSARYTSTQEFYQAMLAASGTQFSAVGDRVALSGEISEWYGQEQSVHPILPDEASRPEPVSKRPVPAWWWALGGGFILLIMLVGFYSRNSNKPLPIPPTSAPTMEIEVIQEEPQHNPVFPPASPTMIPSSTPTITPTPAPTSTPTQTPIPIFLWLDDSYREYPGEKKFTSLAVDKEGNARILYFLEYDDKTDYLMYLTASLPKGSSLINWGLSTQVVSGTGAGQYPNLRLDERDNSFIAYQIGKAKDLIHPIYFEDMKINRQSQVSDSNVDRDGAISMALGLKNEPYITYQDQRTRKLMLATLSSGVWRSEAVADADKCYSFPIEVDQQGNLHLSYQAIQGGLWYATKTAQGWQSPEIVDSSPNAGINSALAVDGFGTPHIAYCDPDVGALMYAFRSGNTWKTIQVDSSVCKQITYGMTPSIHVGPNNNDVHISYFDEINQDLKYALIRNGSLYSFSVIDSEGEVGMFSSLALDSNGLPRISYQDNSNGYLKLAWASLNPSAPNKP